MKKLAISGVVILAIMTLGGAGCSVLFNRIATYTEADTSIITGINQEFVIALQNPTPRVGNHWEESHDDTILSLIDTEYTPDDKSHPDFGGTQNYRFRPLKEGKTEATFTYKTATDRIIRQKVFSIDINSSESQPPSTDGSSSMPQVNTFASSLELYTRKMTLEEAAKIMGITIPVPAYLPTGFKIQEVYVLSRSVNLLISEGPIEKKLVTHTDAAGTRQRYELQSKVEMSISWSPEFMIPVSLPEEKVDIKGRPGYLLETETHWSLLWNWFPDPDNLGVFELGLEVGKGISKEELVKIAESVTFNGTPELYTPQSDQVISDRLYDIKKGEFRYLSVYEDGSLTSIQMEGLREPVSQHVGIQKTGKLSEEELNSLIGFFEDSGFKDMEKNNESSGEPEKGGGVTASDVHYSVSARLGSSYRYIKASNYISPDDGKTYPDMPYPLNEIYKRLKDIADNRT